MLARILQRLVVICFCAATAGATRLASSSSETFPFVDNGSALLPQRLHRFVLGLGVQIYRFVCFRLHSQVLEIRKDGRTDGQSWRRGA